MPFPGQGSGVPMEQQKAPKRDVDAIWRSLNASNANSSKQSFQRLWKGFSSDISKPGKTAAGTRQDTDKKKVPQLNLEPLFYKLTTGAKPSIICKHTPAPDTSLEGAAVDRLVQFLQSADASIRRAALEQVQATYVKAMPAHASEAVAEALSCKLGKALLRRFEDKIEACRELAVSIFKHMLQAGPDGTLGLLPYAMPVLEERLHTEQVQGRTEPSEEIRLLLTQLLSLIIDQAGSAIAAYASEVWSMLSSALADNYHEVAVQGCKIAQQLAVTLGLRLGQTSKGIVAALLPLTTHKRHRVRIAAIEAVRDVMHMGAHEMILEMVGWRDPNMVPIKAFYGDDLKVNFCGKLATDHHVQVRLAFLDLVGNWLLKLRERTDHQPRLLPYLLSGLCDESPAVVQAALELLEKLGQQYEQEHKKELTDVIRFGEQAQDDTEAVFLAALHSGTVTYADCAAEATDPADVTAAVAAAASDNLTSNAATSSFRVPGPFIERPRIGSRLVARNNFGVALHALCAELSSWQSGSRAMSAQLLRINLVLAESAAERHLQVLLPALCAAIRDSVAGQSIADCAAVVGCHCDFRLLLELLTPRALEVTGDARRQADVLLVLAAVLRSAGPVGRLSGNVQQLLDLLSQPGIADSQDSSMKAAATAVMQQLLAPGTAHSLFQPDRRYAAAGESTDSLASKEAATTAAFGAPADKQQHNLLLSTGRPARDFDQRSLLVASMVHLLLRVGAYDADAVTQQATLRACVSALPCNTSTSQASGDTQITEDLLRSAAAAAGYSSVDKLLGNCRTDLLHQFCSTIDLDSAASVAAVCRLLLPSSCASILAADAKPYLSYVTPSSRQLVVSVRQQAEPEGPHAVGCIAPSISGSEVLIYAGEQGQQQPEGFASAAALSACQPSHLSTLLQLVKSAEQSCSKYLQQTPRSMQVLLITLDCCLRTWPAAAFSTVMKQQLLQETVPLLLNSSRSLAAMSGLKALHTVFERDLLPHHTSHSWAHIVGDNAASEAEQRQGQVEGQQQLAQLGQQGNHLQALLAPVCELLDKGTVAIRLQACLALESMFKLQGLQLLQHCRGPASTDDMSPEPAAALTAALDDASTDVRTAAAKLLRMILICTENQPLTMQRQQQCQHQIAHPGTLQQSKGLHLCEMEGGPWWVHVVRQKLQQLQL